MIADERLADVETTNWNAVKLLATQYGIQLRPLEEIKAASCTNSPSNGLDKADVEEVEDLGVGTPFKITAQSVDGGRVVYRFKWRGKEEIARQSEDYEDEAGRSETGYDPGSDSPPSSLGKRAGQRKQASTRTLKTKRSIPLLQMMSSVTQDKSSGSTSSSPIEKKRTFSREMDSARQAAPKVQRGDVLGAILGLREGITAQDYSWIDGRRGEGAAEKQKSPKGKGKERQADVSHRITSTATLQRGPAWRIITSFGEPVMQRHPAASNRKGSDSERSPMQPIAKPEQPNLAEVDDVFHDCDLPAMDTADPTALNTSQEEDLGNEILIFDVLQQFSLKVLDAQEEGGSQVRSSPVISSPPPRSRQPSTFSEVPFSPVAADDIFDEASSIKATPGDDPRFALWAIRSRDEHDTLVLSSRDGIVDHIPPSPQPSFESSISSIPGTPTSQKRFSLRTPNSATSSIDAAPSPGHLSSSQKSTTLPTPNDRAILLAASTSCLVAELTSRIDTQLLTDFFYTYRAYLSSQELLHLLILRLRWAMASPKGAKDEARRKIVRVRTYVVIKYWLSNFFEIDFVPNRALRTQLTDWLNAPSSNENASIIKSLKKIVRGLKKGYEQGGVGAILLSDATPSPEIHVKDQKDSEARGSDAAKLTLEWDDGSRFEETGSTRSLLSTDSWKSAPLPGHHTAPPPLPLSQSAISRAFVTTVGKLSRLRRNLNTRSTALPQSSGHVNGQHSENGGEGFEMEASDGGDLLFIRGGVENFLKFFNLDSTAQDDRIMPSEEDQASDSTTALEKTPSLSTTSNMTSSTPASSIDFGSRERGYGERGSSATRSEGMGAEYGLGISHEEAEVGLDNLTHANLAKTPAVELLHHFQSDQTLRSVSTAQPAEFAESPKSKSSRKQHHRQISKSSSRGPDNVVQLDDIDSSSDEDDGMVRRALRRLPGARDLRMANQIQDLELAPRTSLDSNSVTSFGRIYPPSQRSMNSYYGKGVAMAASSARSSFDDMSWPPMTAPITLQKIGTVQTEMLDPDEALIGYELVKGFRLDQLDESDDEEAGDVEAALRRLEGFIDQDKQKEKQRRVEAMWQRSRAQRDEDEEIEARAREQEKAASRQSAPSAAPTERSDQESIQEQSFVPSTSDHKTKTQTAIPFSNAFRLPTAGAKGHTAKSTSTTALPRLWTPPAPVHRSFLLNHRSEVIAKQFCLIESELFKAVTWQELVSDQWKSRHYKGQVLDWESFYQNSVRRKVESSSQGDPVSNVEAIIARFNLTCNWVASEVVLTRHIDHRAAVVCKLIRIAWKCYHHCNFATLTQIILGLQSPWVERLSKTWSRVGMLEMRMLRDLKAFINPARNFKHLRTAKRDMIIQGGMMDLITSSGPPRSGTKSHLRLTDGCIPFLGLFLSDLTVNDALPTYIEPSSPNSAINYDPSTGQLSTLADPTAFAHLPALPEQVHLVPLVNLYKSRIVAITVKSVLAFQERLSSFEFEADANVYVKTLRIRCLEGEQLTQISQLVEP